MQVRIFLQKNILINQFSEKIIIMGFNKHEDDIINFLTCGHISDIFGLSVDDSNADCEISDLV